MDEILVAFTEEVADLLEVMETGLLHMEKGDRDPEIINSIFRAVHTIKGDAGIVDLVYVNEFAHVMEDTLVLLRSGIIEASTVVVTLLLNGCDHIRALMADSANGQEILDAGLQRAGTALVDALHELVSPSQAVAQPATAVTSMDSLAEKKDICAHCWLISVRFGSNVFRNRIAPLDILNDLKSKGEIVQLATLVDPMPSAECEDPGSGCLSFEVVLRTNETRESLEQTFAFVRHDCELKIRPSSSRMDNYIRSIEDSPDGSGNLGEILVHRAAPTCEAVDQGFERQREVSIAARDALVVPPLRSDLAFSRPLANAELVETAAVKPERVAVKKALEARQIRVQAEKLDQLIDLVGELVISSASAQLKAKKSGQADLAEANAGLVQLVENMRELSTQLRMVRVGDVFNRFKRVARDMAHEVNRDIDLVIRGEDTELDKSVVEKIGDPLMHLLRNAIDHGIEAAAVRRMRGKPVKGTIELNAYHETGGIVIEVADDGAGLDKDRILAKAIEHGLVDAALTLSDQEIIELIFLPGFSTADTVTNISGRGVGMDVVRSNINALRGSVEVQTELGQGSKFIFRLPLTMAIIDGFLVGVSQANYVIPLDMVVECLEQYAETDDRNHMNLRGHALPLLRLRERFGEKGVRPARENVVVVKAGKNMAGIVVDFLHGELQTVIKPLSSLFRNLPGIAGSTILGTGAVALILDVPVLISLAESAGTSKYQH